MNELNDKDWEQVNAYHDGELCAADMRAFEGRPASEPALAAALEDVRNVSVSLAALRPDLVHSESMPETSAANSSWHPRRWLAGGAVAAGIALAVVFGPAFVAPPTAFDIHAELAAEMYDVETADLRPAAVDHHGVDADRLQQHDILREAGRGGVIPHRVPAVLHHEDRVLELLDIRKRFLDEEAGLVDQFLNHGPTTIVRPLSSRPSTTVDTARRFQ